MFVELPKAVAEGETEYNLLVNLERVMWAEPIHDTDTGFEGTRLYMNVAGNNGNPAEVDIDLPYEKFKSKVPEEMTLHTNDGD